MVGERLDVAFLAQLLDCMANILKRIWATLTGAKAPAEPDRKDWKTVGRTFRATDGFPAAGPSYMPPDDEGASSFGPFERNSASRPRRRNQSAIASCGGFSVP